MQQETFLPIGTVIRDRYVVEDLLGKGEGDLVYLVRDRWSAQNLFILKERINPDKQARDRFLVEGVVLKQLRHPALQRVYRVFEENAGYRVYMLMQYIAGQDLETMHRQWPNRSFSLPLTLALLTPIVEAVTYLHSRNDPVIHRDINPSNIIATRNKRTVLVNFGIDRGDNTTEASSSFLFSPGYGAPEQYGGISNPSTDLYALAATFYTLLTGLVPPDAQKRTTQLADKGLDPLIRADVVTSAVPVPIAEAIHRAMSIRSDERFSSVAEFWQALHGLPDSRSIKQTLLVIADAETLELQAISAAPSPVVSDNLAEELHEQLQPPVGADLSCPPPIYRLPSQDEAELEEQPQQEAAESPIAAAVSQPAPSDRLPAIPLHAWMNLFKNIPIRPSWHLNWLQVREGRNARHSTERLYKLLSLPSNFIHLHNQFLAQRSRKPLALLLLALVLVLVLGVGTMLWPRTKASHNPLPTTATPIIVHKTTSTPTIVVHEATPTPTKPTPTKPTPTPSPQAGSIYMGTLHDLLANTSTTISLIGLQLRLSTISGYLQINNGSRGGGLFKGTFNIAQQHIQFIVLDSTGHPIYSFEGGVHPDGNIAGSYCALNQSGQCSGDYGLWSVSPNWLTFSLASRSVL